MNEKTTNRLSPRKGGYRFLIASLWCAVSATCLTAKASAADSPPTAQSTPDQSSAPEQLQEVVVTGTLIRNVAPVGSTLIAMDQEQLQQTGAISLSDALRTLPQVDNLGVSDSSRSGTG